MDNSAEMLANVRGAATVQAEIEALDLGRRFACVLLASQLINVGDRQRAAFLATCARHVAPDGVVLIQRYDPDWAADPRPSASEHGDLRMRVIDPRREARHLTATVEYVIGDRRWQHGPFTSTILDDAGPRGAPGGERVASLSGGSTSAGPGSPLAAAGHVRAVRRGAACRAARGRAAAGVRFVGGGREPGPRDRALPLPGAASDRRGGRADLGQIAAAAEPFDLRLGRIGRFPGVVWLAPEPAAPFAALTDAVAARWPDRRPYEGAHDRVIHHLTVADGAPDGARRFERTVAAGLPLRDRVTDLTLAVRESGSWFARARFSLGRN